ncbi:putative amidoligase domain-containing protein [Salinithrix halophila]
MEALNLILDNTESLRSVRDQIVTSEKTLTPSIRLQGIYAEPMLVLNDEVAVKGLASREHKIACLKIHGLPTIAEKTTLLRQYILCIFQTRVLLVYCSKVRQAWLAGGTKTKREAFRRVPSADNTREVRRIRALAIRALYATGLDYGVVKMGIQPGNTAVVLDVKPAPRLNKGMEAAFAEAINGYVTQLPRLVTEPDQVVLGADPEFLMCRTGGGLVMASRYFPRFGRVGCDAIWHGQNRADKPLVELRPQPTNDPRQLVIRLYKGMLVAAKRVNMPQIQWLAGALPHPRFPLGGHIHFSGISVNFKLLRALDHYLALPMVLVEDKRGVYRRPKYGFLGDFRPQFHGGFEYRTLPSWLISPVLTKGVLAAAQLIVARYPFLPATDFRDLSVQRSYYNGEKENLRARAARLWEELRLLPEYKVHQRYLDTLSEFLFSGKTWDESKDFRTLWKLPPYHR